MDSFLSDKLAARKAASRFKTPKRLLAFARSMITAILQNYWDQNLGEKSNTRSWNLPPHLQDSDLWKLTKSDLKLSGRIGTKASEMSPDEAGYFIGCLYTIMIPKDTRSSFGIYYTPPALVNRLLDMAESAGADWGNHFVLDPACGGGAFLAPVATRIIKALGDLPSEEILNHISTHLRGFEIDPFAAWMSQVFLEIAMLDICIESSRRLPVLVDIKDSLYSRPIHPEFDVIIGNR